MPLSFARLRKFFSVISAIFLILFIWQCAAWSLPDYLMPDVPVVLAHFWQSLGEAEFQQSVMDSLSRLGSGYGFAVIFGVVLSLLVSLLVFFKDTFKAAIVILQAIPSIAWVPLFLIVMGFGNLPIIVVVAIGAFFPISLSVMNATENVNKVHIQAARIMGASPLTLLRRVYLPAVMPELITGAQLAFGNAWRALISAEMLIGFGNGIGRNLAYSGEIADMIGVMESILVVAILAAIIDQVILEGLKRRVLRYQYL